MYKVTYVSSKNIFGTMNSSTVRLTNLTDRDRALLMNKYNLTSLEGFTDSDITKEDKRIIFNSHSKEFGDFYSFDGSKMFMADQIDKNGSYFEITKEYVEDNPNGWSDIKEDILVITSKVPEVVIGHPVADCPVIMMTDKNKGVAAIAHCSAELIDKKLPIFILNALKEYGCSREDINVYISACAGPNWTYDCFPRWAQDLSVWEESITCKDKEFKIDLRKTIKKQLDSVGLKNIVFNMDDTITNDSSYSNSASKVKSLKYGRHFEGLYFNK